MKSTSLLRLLCAGLFLVVALASAHAAVKWHPGHYVNINPRHDGESAFDVVVNNDCLAGAQLIFYWREFEKEKDVYDFSQLRRWMKYLVSKGKRTMLLLVLQSYGSGGPCVPDYLLQDPLYEGGQVVYKDTNGKPRRAAPRFWVPAVTDRLIALNRAIAREFDNEPAFELFQRAEIAVPKPAETDTGYSVPAINREALREFEDLCTAFKHTVVVIGANWITRDDSYFQVAAKSGVGGLGGPDIVMRHTDNPLALDGTWAYPHYPKYRGKIPLTICDQGAFDTNAYKGMTMDQVWDFAIANPAGLSVSHVVWTASRPSFRQIQLPYIQAKKGYIANTACPENIRQHGGGCDTSALKAQVR